MSNEVVEHGQLYSGGDLLVWARGEDVECVYPPDLRIEHAQRNGGRVFRRRIVVLEDWTEVALK